MSDKERPFQIDCLQYAQWSETVFRQMREGGVDAVHVTIAYHEDFVETVRNICAWNRLFEAYPSFVLHGQTFEDLDLARKTNRTAIFFGLQNPSPIGGEIDLIAILHKLGVRFMQLTYNLQSLLAGGCYETVDSGITRMGREAIAEMNRVGMVIDMSHSGERSTLEAIEFSSRPITITHANPNWWHDAVRNKSDQVLKSLGESGGMLGFSLYPLHLAGGSSCSLDNFCEMIARSADRYGIAMLGLGSDLCQDRPPETLHWMRKGRWQLARTDSENVDDGIGFPPMPEWFRDNSDFGNLACALDRIGFAQSEVNAIMGENWRRFFKHSFEPG